MTISPFFISALLLCYPYGLAAFHDLKRLTVPLQTWGWTLLALPTSILGWYYYYNTVYFDSRIFLILAGFIAAFFISMILYQTGNPSIGGSDVIGISLMLLYVPVLPELGTAIYIFPLCVCTLICSLYWNVSGRETPFLFPFMVCHIGLIISTGFI